LLAQLLRRISAMKPSAVGLDIILSEESSADDDRELAAAISDSGNVVLAARLSSSPHDKLWVDPLPAFAKEAAIGHVQAITGPDGICRSVPVQELSAASGPRWAMALEVFRTATKSQLKGTGRGVWAGNVFLRTQGSSSSTRTLVGESFSPAVVLIDFRKQVVPGEDNPAFLTLSAADLLEGKPVPSLAGKSVLVGLGAIDASDRVFTPVSDRLPMPGVEVHANLLDAVLEGRSLRTLRWPGQLLMIAIVSGVCTFVVLRWPGALSVVITIAVLLTIFLSSFMLLLRGNLVLDLAPLLCAAVIALPMAQVETLVSVNRGVTRSLQQIGEIIRHVHPQSNLVAAGSAGAVAEISWKLQVLQNLQEELTSLYAFRQNLLLAMEEGIAVYAEDGRLLFSNPRWRIFCENQQADPMLDLKHVAAALGKPELEKIAELRLPQVRFDAEIQTKDSLWQVRAFPVETGAESSPSLMLVATDFTASLERDRARSEAVGFVTHELRTPLSSIQGFAELLVRYPRADAGTEAAATIFRESRRLVALIDTYLEVLRLEAGQAPMRREELNLIELTTQAKRIIEPIADATETRITSTIASDLPRVEGDPNLIAGVLLNLLNNAVKYSPTGSEIKMNLTASAGNVVIEVSNPGSPIPPRDLSRIFDSFYRGAQRSGTERGWGLGLAFVKRIAENHGGRVELTSDSAATIFRVMLPQAAQQRATGA
jgi:signal transduction histidine kinase